LLACPAPVLHPSCLSLDQLQSCPPYIQILSPYLHQSFFGVVCKHIVPNRNMAQEVHTQDLLVKGISLFKQREKHQPGAQQSPDVDCPECISG
jgi:hypothetical protein